MSISHVITVGRHRLSRYWLVGGVCCLISSLTLAQDNEVIYHIPAQDLAAALNQFALDSKRDILFSAAEVGSLKSTPIDGRYTPEQALQILLQSSGLNFQINDAGVILIETAPAAIKPVSSETNPSAHNTDRYREIESITVTARKVEESAQDVPLSLSAFNGQQLKNQGVQEITDIQYQVPSLVFSQTATSSFSPLVSMRGQTQGTIAISVDPSVGVYVDGVYLTGTAGLGSYTNLDIQRVEVLKGPQGTLFGRNSTGGAVSLYTQTPTQELEGEISTRQGNYGYQEYSGVVNVPLVDNILAARFAGMTSTRDGYGVDHNRDVDVGSQDLSTLRGSFLLTPNERFSALLRLDTTDGDDNGLLTHPLYIDPEVAIPSLSEGSINLTGSNTPEGRDLAAAYFQDLIDSDPFDVRYNTDTFSKIDTENYSLTLDYHFDAFDIKSISGWRHTDDRRRYEIDTTDIINFASVTEVNLDQFTQELQLTGLALDDKLKYVVGAYYYELDGNEKGTAQQFTNLTGGLYQVTEAHLDTKSYAGFSQLSYALTDDLQITAGLRYTWEEKIINALGGSGSDSVAFTCSLPEALDPDLTSCNVRVPHDEENLSYSLALDYHIKEDVMAYIRTARSFKSGGVNQRIIGNNPLSANPLESEQVTDYEIGLKADWLDGKLRTSAAYYHSLYDNIQRSAVTCAGVSCSSVLFNAAQGTIDGVELELVAIPVTGLRLAATAAYTHPQYDEFESGGIDNAQENFLEVPEWTYSLSAGYVYPLPYADLRGQLDWSWRSEMDMAPQDYPGGIRLVGGVPTANGPGTPDNLRIQPSYGLLNALVAVEFNQGYEVRVYAKNLLNESYWSHALGNVNGGLGLAIATPGAPRTYGVELKYSF